jgi:putative FmdB family regulatory protein
MPIYEYQCRRCGHRLEAMQKVSDPPLRRCPECRGGLKKLVSAPAFQFKGSGWYVTDYAGKKGAEPKGEGEGAAGAGEAKAETAAESKGEKGKAAAAGEAAGSAAGGSKRAGRGAAGAG